MIRVLGIFGHVSESEDSVQCLKTCGNKFLEAMQNQHVSIINEYFKKYDENPDILKRYRSTFNDPGEKTDEFLETYFVTNVVDSTFYSYFTSELVGEEVMPYDPIPVKYEGCLPYEPGQKSWASV